LATVEYFVYSYSIFVLFFYYSGSGKSKKKIASDGAKKTADANGSKNSASTSQAGRVSDLDSFQVCRHKALARLFN